jgi:hypothetical protein
MALAAAKQRAAPGSGSGKGGSAAPSVAGAPGGPGAAKPGHPSGSGVPAADAGRPEGGVAAVGAALGLPGQGPGGAAPPLQRRKKDQVRVVVVVCMLGGEVVGACSASTKGGTVHCTKGQRCSLQCNHQERACVGADPCLACVFVSAAAPGTAGGRGMSCLSVSELVDSSSCRQHEGGGCRPGSHVPAAPLHHHRHTHTHTHTLTLTHALCCGCGCAAGA